MAFYKVRGVPSEQVHATTSEASARGYDDDAYEDAFVIVTRATVTHQVFAMRAEEAPKIDTRYVVCRRSLILQRLLHRGGLLRHPPLPRQDRVLQLLLRGIRVHEDGPRSGRYTSKPVRSSPGSSP